MLDLMTGAGGIATVTLRRAERHNALNPELIAALESAFREIAGSASTRVAVLAAEGRSFCAGADLEWMREAVEHSFEENVAEAMALGRMLRAIQACPKPVIARIQGPAYGGGAGLAAACDLAVALDSATFCFSEAKLGLIPAVISPFVLRKIPPGAATRYFITAETIPAEEARRIGLIAEVVQSQVHLDERVAARARQLLGNGPEAIAACKELVDDVAGPVSDALLERAARRIAERRASDEGQEGMRAFLEKRPPSWSGREEAR